MKKILLIVTVVCVVVGVFYFLNKNQVVAPVLTVSDLVEKGNVEKYLQENISKLSPVLSVLGGTWYVVSSNVNLEKKSGTVTYEDGHIQEIRNFSYIINEKREVLSLYIIDPVEEGPFVCTEEAKICPDGSAVSRTGPNCEFTTCPDILNTTVGTGSISGTVTTSPTCSMERIPQEARCAPRPYITSIEVKQTGWASAIKIKTDASGKYNIDVKGGTYILKPYGGSVFPRCESVTVFVKAGENIVADISCDTGIR